jgi:hypothetical protein
MDDPVTLNRQGRRPLEDPPAIPALAPPSELPLADRLITYMDHLADTGNRLQLVEAAYRENWLQQVEPTRARTPEAADRDRLVEHDRYRDI